MSSTAIGLVQEGRTVQVCGVYPIHSTERPHHWQVPSSPFGSSFWLAASLCHFSTSQRRVGISIRDSKGSVTFDDFCELLDFEDMPEEVLAKCPSHTGPLSLGFVRMEVAFIMQEGSWEGLVGAAHDRFSTRMCSRFAFRDVCACVIKRAKHPLKAPGHDMACALPMLMRGPYMQKLSTATMPNGTLIAWRAALFTSPCCFEVQL